jgi:hypothetical protein
MSIKKYFEVAATIQSLANKSAADIASEIESVGYHEQDIIEEERFIPRIDFSKPENFARYGSAEEYYDSAIKRIYNTYPYDGSLQERLKWVNESTYLDLYIYDEKYPRTNGYVIMSADGAATDNIADGYGRPSTLEYIYVKGGPNPHPVSDTPYSTQFTGSNYYEPSMNRGSNLELNLATDGVSLEFWFKKDGFLDPTITNREVIFDLWNGENSSSVDYGRLRLELTGNVADGSDPFLLTVLSGTTGIDRQPIAASTVTSASVADGSWHHYAVTLKSASAGITTRFYIDGDLNNETTQGTVGINDFDSSTLRAYVGALITSVSGTTTPSVTQAGDGKLSGSLDELRYWKTQRSSKDIGRFWFTQVGGGVNTDPQPFIDTVESGNVDLGVYFKFNEGITGVAATDSVVLDYSGRFSNGAWTGYTANSRNTGSAIVSSSAAIKEFRDPIIYSFHPAVESLSESLKLSGSAHDGTNNASIYNSIPAWITEEDFEGQKNLVSMTQIMSSYFDTLQLQIESLNTLKDKQYPSGSDKPLPFAEKLLAQQGFVAPDLFLDADLLEKLADRSEDLVYEQSLHDTKNTIYQNIYNNLSYIYKTKGTTKAFRNLIRCFGIDEELIKINMYADNVEYELKNNRKNIAVADKFVDFNTRPGTEAVVYNYADPSNPNTLSFIPSNTHLTGGYAITMETEVLFPLKLEQSQLGYINTNVISSSLFGMHGSRRSTTDTTWDGEDRINFQVYAERDELDSSNVRFVLTGTAGGYVPRLTSDLYQDVYNNTRWNLAVRIKPETYPLKGMPTGSDAGLPAVNNNYIVELYGVQAQAGEIIEEFTVSQTLTTPPAGFITGSRRAYVGAHRQDFTGSVLEKTDVKINASRYWLDYVEDEALRGHILDTENHGALQPHLYAYPFDPSASFGDITKFDTLVFNWEFLNNTGSNAAGQFTVSDLSSGSADFTRFGLLGQILNRQYTASGSFFAPSSTTPIDKDFVVSSKMNLPEHIYSEDMVSVLSAEDQDTFTSDSRPINYFFSFEKSMYQVISKEIINYFANLKDFNNLIGDPVERYRPHYKQLAHMRQRFFENVENEVLDFDKFYEFYKWFDTSLSIMLSQLVPASADVAEAVTTMIENHVLERPKYRNKFPFLQRVGGNEIAGDVVPAGDSSEGASPDDFPSGLGIIGNSTLTRRQIGSSNPPYSKAWKFFHAPVPNTPGGTPPETEKMYWHRYRQEREDSVRSDLLTAIQQTYNRRIGSVVRLTADGGVSFGGVGRHHNNRPNYTFGATAPYGPTVPSTNIPKNIMLGFGRDVEQLVDTTDIFFPTGALKQRLGFGLDPGINDVPEERKLDGNIYAPFSLYSSSVKTGYNVHVMNKYKSGSMITNLHNDFVQGHDIPMQGPFPEKFVGGRFYRHTEINDGNDTREDRAEGFRVELGSLASPMTGTVGIVPPNYPFGSSPFGSAPHGFLPELPTAQRFRDETAKRPVNIKNILMTTASVGTRLSGTITHNPIGNYQKNYEVINTGGRTYNDPYFQDQSFSFALNPETLATRGRFPLDPTSTANVDGNLEFELPNRSGPNSNQSIIVNRFSAPGDYSVLSRGYMEPAHEELSVNNASPYRNQRVINFGLSGSASLDPSIQNTIRVVDQIQKNRGLNQLSTLHCGPFGSDAAYGSVPELTYVTVPSWQKTNRNALRRIEQMGEVYVTGTVYDNLFVQYAIPRSTQQYSWVTGSMISGSAILGLEPVSCCSASVLSELVTSGTYASSDFVGLRSLVIDPVSQSSHILGFPLATEASSAYYNSALNLGLNNGSDYFNILINNRGGAFGYSSWKQIRSGESPVARKLREANLLGTVLAPSKVPNRVGGKDTGFIQPLRPNTFVDYYEAPVANNSSPLYFYFEDNTEDSNAANNMVLTVPFRNELDYFTNNGLNNRLGLEIDLDASMAYSSLIDYTLKSSLSVVVNYEERLYPSALNTYKSAVRGRENYTINNIWNNSRTERSLTYGGQQGSMGQSIASASVWPMDAHLNYTTTSSVNATDGAGELMNSYSRYSGSSAIGITAAPTYAMRVPIGTTASLPVLAGDTKWLVAEQSGKTPYVEYSTYAEKIRAAGKDFSIIPEYRVSELMEDYINTNEGDFLASLDNIFSLTGASIPNSSDDNFYKTYTNADFLRYFKVIDDDLNDQRSGDLKILRDKVALKCDALIKFLPYKGFYPAERTLELAHLFSQSYGNSVVNRQSGYSADSNQALRILLEPMYAPGIMFNTIKSGLAVSNFVLVNTSSNPNTQLKAASNATYYRYTDNTQPSPQDFRVTGTLPLYAPTNQTTKGGGFVPAKVPFEAIYQPESYFNQFALPGISGSAGTRLYDTAPSGGLAHISASLLGNPRTAYLDMYSFNGSQLYRLAIDNFLCATTDIFTEGNVNFQSAREEDFLPVTSGSTYKMEFQVYRTKQTGSTAGIPDKDRFTMYNNELAYGTPLVTFDPSNQRDITMAHVSPPYYSGPGYVRFTFQPTTSGIPTIQDIFANTTIQYGRTINYGSSDIGTETEPVVMQLDSCFNFTDTLQEVPSGTVSLKDRWLIQSKFETPILNFAGVNTTVPPTSSVPLGGDSADDLQIRGMWHQYGQIPTGSDEGVFAIINAGSGSTHDSLAAITGFSVGDPRRLGSVKKEFKLEEAIVAVPYREVKNRRKFIEITETDKTSNTYRKLTAAMNKYVFPPKFDFTKFKTVTPILMYVFEFSANLTQQDVSDIWQNVPPDLGEKFETQEAVIEEKELIDLVLSKDSDTKWMVFKVKKAAPKDFEITRRKLVTDSVGALSPNITTPLSYNWPYDYFSLVELAKMDEQVQYVSTDLKQNTRISETEALDVDRTTNTSNNETSNISGPTETATVTPTSRRAPRNGRNRTRRRREDN